MISQCDISSFKRQNLRWCGTSIVFDLVQNPFFWRAPLEFVLLCCRRRLAEVAQTMTNFRHPTKAWFADRSRGGFHAPVRFAISLCLVRMLDEVHVYFFAEGVHVSTIWVCVCLR
eukprot:GEMP01076153.1.p1 GENE.GEMP01076153.1~~GEMP01076153.1.p1  ORF type:complete len:115 (-),score=17.61 GEMP01076153.1:75-419(-)